MEAEILDREQAGRIRQFEAEQAPHHRARWPVIAALGLGGVMLAAGVLLFVSAHWDELSATQRMALLVTAVGGFHVAGALTLERFRALGITLHAVGTVALGGAIAMAGQIFNMQEHWPSAVMLWSAGAAAGYWLLRDWPHLVLTALLLPWWLGGEWTEAAGRTLGNWPVPACGVLLLAICYLSVRVGGGGEDHVRRALAWLGGLALLPATLVVAFESHEHRYGVMSPTDAGLLSLGWVVALGAPLLVAYVFRRDAVWMNAVAAIWVVGLHLAGTVRMDVLVYGWCALGAAGMVAWGIFETRVERINLGMAGFALTIVFFFFSSVMDQLGRSASLMALGILFVGGGWYWEKLRRRLVAGLAQGGVQ